MDSDPWSRADALNVLANRIGLQAAKELPQPLRVAVIVWDPAKNMMGSATSISPQDMVDVAHALTGVAEQALREYLKDS